MMVTRLTLQSLEVVVRRSGKLLLVFASTVIPGFGPRGTNDRIFLFHNCDRVNRLLLLKPEIDRNYIKNVSSYRTENIVRLHYKDDHGNAV
jgi:hypothetical protein